MTRQNYNLCLCVCVCVCVCVCMCVCVVCVCVCVCVCVVCECVRVCVCHFCREYIISIRLQINSYSDDIIYTYFKFIVPTGKTTLYGILFNHVKF